MKYAIKIDDMNLDQLKAVVNTIENVEEVANTEEVKEAPVVEEVKEAPVAQPAPVVEEVKEVVNTEEVVAFDKDGLPWDERIHSSNHKLTAQGVWQRRRGVADELFEQVKNELLGVAPVAQPAPVVAPVAQPAPVVAPAPIPAPVAAIVTPAPVQNVTPQEYAAPFTPTPVAQPTPVVAPAPVAQPEQDAKVVYNTMFVKLRDAFAAKKIDGNFMQQVLARVNASCGTDYKGIAEFQTDIKALNIVLNVLAEQGL